MNIRQIDNVDPYEIMLKLFFHNDYINKSYKLFPLVDTYSQINCETENHRHNQSVLLLYLQSRLILYQ